MFVRDRKGKMASESVRGKDERVKVFLRQCELSGFRFFKTKLASLAYQTVMNSCEPG